MRKLQREKLYYCGEYLTAYLYPVFQERPVGGKRKKRKPSSEAQKKLNERHKKEKLLRLEHANFTPDDLEIHMTYREEPESEEEARRHLSNFLRRVRRYMKKHGLGELKYIAVTERGKRGGRFHHHVTIGGGIDRNTLESMWEHGYANSRRLQFTEEGLEGLVNYISKSPVGKKAWTASKNLVDPEPKIRDGRVSAKKAKDMAEHIQDSGRFEELYPGYLLSKAEVFHNDVNGGNYIVAQLYRADGKFIKAKKRKKPARPKTREGAVKSGNEGRRNR